MAYPYSLRETLADGTVHAAGLALAAVGVIALLAQAHMGAPGAQIAALYVYAVAILLAFAASAIYHLSPFDRTRPLLHKIDHAAIYLKIAGTYTPLVVMLGSAFGYFLLGVIWTIAAAGAALKLSVWHASGRLSLGLYLAMGWAAVLLVPLLFSKVPTLSFALIVAGGLLYTAGTVIFARDGMRYQNAIWHGFVLIGSACFFAAIALTIGSPDLARN